MKNIKRYILLVVLLVLLIGCFAFSVLAEDVSSVSETEEITLTFVLDGVTYSYSCSSDATWNDLNGVEFYIGDNQGTLKIIDGYVVLHIALRDGTSYNYRLSHKVYESDDLYKFVLVNDELDDNTAYSLNVTIGIDDGGGGYWFEYPSYILTFNDLINFDQDYSHPKLGQCRWVEYKEMVVLEAVKDGELNTYFLTDVYGSDMSPEEDLFEDDYAKNYWRVRTTCLHDVHSWEAEILVAPTCTTAGQAHLTCTICEYERTVDVPGGHKYEQISVEWSSCTEPGYTRYQCFACSEIKDEPIAPLGHYMDEFKESVAPTCTASGLEISKCLLCNYEQSRTVDALGHDLDVLGNCKRCDYSRVGDALANAGNAIVDGWNNLFGGISGSAGAEDDEKKTLWDYITGLIPGGSSSSEEGINTTLDGIARILSLVLVLVLGLVLFPLLKPLFQLLGDLISYGVSGVKSLSKKVKNKKKS